MTVKSLRKQLAAAIAMTLVATVALGSSTYAWFVSNTKVTAETVQVTAQAANTLLISDINNGNWRTLLPLTDTVDAMKPVSTVGSDGTSLVFVKDDGWETDSVDSMSYAKTFQDAEANTDYLKTTFYIKGSVAGSKLYLDTDTTFEMATYDDDNDSTTPEVPYDDDVLSTLRLGLVVTGANSQAKTFIYQVATGNLATYYDTTIDSTTAVNGIARAMKKDTTSAAGAVDDVMNVDNAAAIGAILKATAPVDGTHFVETTNGADLLYTFASSGDVATVEAYIWMEGCDYDCNSAMVATITAQTVLAKLGFAVADATP